MQYLSKFVAATLVAVTIVSCTEETSDTPAPAPKNGSFSIELDHVFGSQNFALNQSYTNASGEDVTFSKVAYYISNIQLEKMDGTVWQEEESYRIVDASSTQSMLLSLTDVPAGEYHKLSFQVGVDSIRNVSGAQDGALSPANNMFWTWNSDYIFVKLEGASSAAPTGSFVYHLGGFAGPNKANLTKNIDMHMQLLNIQSNANPKVHLMVDLQSVFDGMHTVSLANTSSVRMPGQMALHLAHNFSAGVSLDHIHN